MTRMFRRLFNDYRSSQLWKIVLFFVVIGCLWAGVSTLLSALLQWPMILDISLRVLYFVVTGFVLSLWLWREHVHINEERQYERILNSIMEPLVIHAKGTILAVNERAVEFFHVPSMMELVSRKIVDFVEPNRRDTFLERIAALENGQPSAEKFVTPTGIIRDVEVAGIPICFHGSRATLTFFRDLTDRNRFEAALRTSENQLRALIDSLPDKILVVDREGRWIEANRQLLRILSIDSDMYRGRTTHELSNLCAPEFRLEFLNQSRCPDEMFERETLFTHETSLPDGRSLVHEITCSPMVIDAEGNRGLVVVARDVTAQRLAAHRLAESEQRYRSLFDNDGDMVMSVNCDGMVLAVNPSCESSLGYACSELVGKHYSELLHPRFRSESSKRFHDVVLDKPQSLDVTLVDKSGREIHVKEKKVPIVTENKVTGFFWILRDVTSQVIADELLIQSERLSAVGQMAAGIAHEIRNPLTALKGFVQLMSAANTNDATYLRIMQSELERIELIINELLVFSKPSNLSTEVQNVSALIKEVVGLMLPEASMKSIVISTWVESEALQITCDKNRIKQVLVNLVKNAIEAMSSGGHVSIQVRARNTDVVISVCDTGPGIPPETLERIGEPFYTTKATGTGLGILVSRKIVESHSGTLKIRSELDHGTEVEVAIPYDASGHGNEARAAIEEIVDQDL